jgi:hypothetical protein
MSRHRAGFRGSPEGFICNDPRRKRGPEKGVTLKFWYKHRYPQHLESGGGGAGCKNIQIMQNPNILSKAYRSAQCIGASLGNVYKVNQQTWLGAD